MTGSGSNIGGGNPFLTEMDGAQQYYCFKLGFKLGKKIMAFRAILWGS
jgi:hypothetical protein